MSNVEEYAKKMLELSKLAEDFNNEVNRAFGSSPKWALGEVIESYLSIFDRFCPFKVGDRVELLSDVEVKKAHGWVGCEHFLKKGEKATVYERGYSNGKFVFDIIFDNETWIDLEGIKRQVSNKHTFRFGEKQLKMAQP